MKFIRVLSFFMVVTVCVTIFGSTSYATVQDFSANLTCKGEDGTFESKAYIGFCKIRVETEKVIYIMRTDLDPDVGWMIMPETKTYSKIPLYYAFPWNIFMVAAWPYGAALPSQGESDVVNGRAAIKYNMKDNDNSKVLGHVWVDKASQVVLKMNDPNSGSSIEFKDVKVGVQNLKLFEVPSGYVEVPFDTKIYSDGMRNK